MIAAGDGKNRGESDDENRDDGDDAGGVVSPRAVRTYEEERGQRRSEKIAQDIHGASSGNHADNADDNADGYPGQTFLGIYTSL